MNPRLEKIFECIENGTGVIDVGTDHGYLPVELARKGYTGNIFASDINREPIMLAKQNAENAGVSDRINFSHCDGLEECPPDKIDTIVIAGMGGDTICGILDRAEWSMDSKYTLLLQPMTKQEVIRYWLVYNEYEILDEVLVKDSGTVYQIIKAKFGGYTALNDAELFTGEFEKVKNNECFPELLTALKTRFEKAKCGLISSDREMEGKIKLIGKILLELDKMVEGNE